MGVEDIIYTVVEDYMWGLPMVIFILAVGVYITVRSGFFQFRGFGRAMKRAFGSFSRKKNGDSKSSGVLSSFQAMSTALGTTIGVGNIGGVATALAFGGPGAVFWMWVAGLLGMVIKSAEITLAVHYRTNDKNGGEAYGGPNYYIKKGIGEELHLKKLAKVLSALFAIGFMMGYFLNIQTYTVSEAMASTFNMNMLVIGVIFTILLYVMIAGGLKEIGNWAQILVPIMCIFYIVGGLIVICKNITEVPSCFALIFKSAFNGTAAIGGFAGATMSLAIRTGMSRSVFSNEAGWGSAPMIHASAKVDHPVKQGMLGIFEVFIDTFIICTLTCLICMTSGVWSSGLEGASLTLEAFETGMGSAGRIILAIGVFVFGLTTASGLYAEMEVVLRYFFGNTRIKKFALLFYKWTYPIPALILVIVSVVNEFADSTVWLISDAGTALPIFINTFALLILAPKFTKLLKDFNARHLGKGEIDPNAKVFYDSVENEAVVNGNPGGNESAVNGNQNDSMQ